jgi:hypothetical protein
VGAIGDPYITLTELKSYLSMEDDSRFDAELTSAIASISKEINRHCNRQFNKAASPSWRSFKILYPGYVSVADFWDDPVEIQVSSSPDAAGTVAAAGSYVLEPLDGIVDEEPGWPRWIIKPSSTSGLSLVPGMYLRMNAPWGWESVPAEVPQSAKIMAGATFQIKDAPFGVAGSDQWGAIRVKDNQMAINKLNRLVKDRILVG